MDLEIIIVSEVSRTKTNIIWYHSYAATKSLQSCPTLCDPIDGSPLGSSVSGILQARILEWGAVGLLQCMKVKNESEK